ncbi:hypothetical protein BOTBODRAFT_54858 [Botryobasidium botryosum FD-172 SS1]|uniref:Secreted protein n=1 Tax=Botryobasidium botryosum (strain FD-172 SS1) TaxID=930990 RepID=A0A067MUN4_BOTB1|nr:hypothetical protein BOTBODRAFT_54858 [Botryobasidium botryosum FD-172 SS1]
MVCHQMSVLRNCVVLSGLAVIPGLQGRYYCAGSFVLGADGLWLTPPHPTGNCSILISMAGMLGPGYSHRSNDLAVQSSGLFLWLRARLRTEVQVVSVSIQCGVDGAG